MHEARGAWHDVGRIPALVVVGLFYVVALVVAFALDASYAWLGAAAFVLLIAYCVARPRGGFDVFCAAAAPGALGGILDSLLGLPRPVGFAFVPFALWFVWSVDRTPAEDDEAQALAP